METLRVGRGFSDKWTVTLKDAKGAAVTGVYDGTEPLDLVVCDLAGAALTLSASSVVWLGPAAATVTLAMDEIDTVDMAAGPRGLSIGITIGGKRYECYRATLRVEPRPIT